MRSKTEYRDFYGRLKDLPLAVSRETGALLYMLARSMRRANDRRVRHLVRHLDPASRRGAAGQWRGRLITSEFEPSKVARARDNLTAGGLIDLVEIREGDALQTLSVDLPETVDLLLLDGAKALYPEILSLVESRLRPGAFIVADNADYSPDYLARLRSPRRATCPCRSPRMSSCRCAVREVDKLATRVSSLREAWGGGVVLR